MLFLLLRCTVSRFQCIIFSIHLFCSSCCERVNKSNEQARNIYRSTSNFAISWDFAFSLIPFLYHQLQHYMRQWSQMPLAMLMAFETFEHFALLETLYAVHIKTCDRLEMLSSSLSVLSSRKQNAWFTLCKSKSAGERENSFHYWKKKVCIVAVNNISPD